MADRRTKLILVGATIVGIGVACPILWPLIVGAGSTAAASAAATTGASVGVGAILKAVFDKPPSRFQVSAAISSPVDSRG